MSEKTKNTIVVLEPSAKSAKELIALLEEKGAADVVRTSTPDEALQHIVTTLPCMFITSMNDNAEVPSRIQLLKRLENAIKHHGLKVYVVTPLKNRQLADLATQKLGVSDFIIEPMPVRTMQFKANLQLKAIDSFRRQQEMKKAADEKMVFKKQENAKQGDAAEVKPGANKPASPFGRDTFLFKNSGVKKDGKKVTVELEGPDPSTGEWVQHEDKGDPQAAWRWVPTDEKEAQAKGEAPPDGWVHKGEKPQFNEESGKWKMTSEKPSLALVENGVPVSQKLSVDEKGEVVVAEDTLAAAENLKRNKVKALQEKNRKEAERKTGKAQAEAEAATAREVKLKAANEEKASAAVTERAVKAGESPGEAPAASLAGEKGTDEEKGASAGELKDLRNPGEKNGPALQDRRAKSAKNLEEIVPGGSAPAGEEDAEPSAALNPLSILQKKKEEKREAVPRIGREDGPKGVNELKESAAEEAAEAGPIERKKKKGGDALEKLNKLLDGKPGENGDTGNDPASLAGEDGTEDAEDAGDTAQAGGRPAIKLGSSRKGGKAEALREDPADIRGDFQDLRETGPIERRVRLKDERTNAKEKLQELLEAPLPETMSAEEEAAVREELGLKDRPDIQPKELARKKKLKDAKNLKDKLAALESELNVIGEEETGEAHSSSGLSTESRVLKPRRAGDLAPDKLTGIRGAYDGEEAVAEHEEELRKRIKVKQEQRKRESALKDRAEYMPEAELLPLGNAWESAGSHYVYLDASVRYKGFGKLEDLLPLWIFEGEDIPQLLSKTKQWRFLGGRPFQAKTLGEIPPEVRDFLIGLRDQVGKGDERPHGEAAGTDAAGDEEAASAAKQLEDAVEEAQIGEPAEEKAAPPAAKRRSKGKVRDLGKNLEDLMGSGEDPAEKEARAAAEDLFSGEEETGDDEAAPESEDLSASLDPEAGEEPDGAGSSADDATYDDLKERPTPAAEAPAAKKAKTKDGKEDKLADLRARLGMEEESGDDEGGDGEANSGGRDAEEQSAVDTAGPSSRKGPAATGEEPGDTEENPGRTEEPVSETIQTLAKSKSEGVQKFLEKRKKKLEEATSAESPQEASASSAADKPKEPPPGYLGIYVALSDAFANVSGPEFSLKRVLASIEGSFKDCSAYFTSAADAAGTVAVLYHGGDSPAPVERIPLSGGLSEPVKWSHGGSEEILGYLYLGTSGARTGFDEAEEATLRRLAGKVWPMAVQLGREAERKAA